MKIISAADYREELLNPKAVEERNEKLDESVLSIIAEVRKNGDKALFSYTEQFDKVKLQSLLVSEAEFAEARGLVSKEFLTAMEQAKENITSFHSEQKERSWFVNKENGVLLGQKVTPLERVGIYVPGGKAAYPSTVLMDALPAKIAGVPSITMTTPPQQNGKVNPHVLVAAELAGVDKVYKIGGAQAIAALAYGTETIEKVYKIVGPGNAFVARAKKWVYGDVAIDMIAGPSEICVVADDTCNTSYAAADLLSQAEHDEQASAICVVMNEQIGQEIQAETLKQLKQLERSEIAGKSIADNGRIVIASDFEEAYEIVNLLAPEHLQLMVANPMEAMNRVHNAGAIFLGNYSPEPLGDYFAGPNHTLPTNGTAAFASPLGVYDFIKKSSIISYSRDALLQAADSIATIANMEGLTAHAKSITIRKDDTK
ncbi:histidinol dehydrogenase [Aciduricibacillus chroicocephali]|uniref:Histidinol dehydrogenase n=1 Tax=Aciduricibacillus chroicocephali TaxID=3054939 RepID=A0ABY9KWK2_9BACI|nr:histidinol dehydrogenase [Bacillaceae bacterium 44XB]